MQNDSSVTGVKSSPYDILDEIQAYDGLGRAYGEKQLHKVPDAPVVNRRQFVIERCTGKVVLDIGCASGELHAQLLPVVKQIYGIDKDSMAGPNYAQFDLDELGAPPVLPFVDRGIELIVCGETLEHLSNPGWLLNRIATSFPSAELLITVPNAFSRAGASWLARGVENVNRDHVAWYSYHTLKVLAERYGFAVKESFWYGGEPLMAEGLIFSCRLANDKVRESQPG